MTTQERNERWNQRIEEVVTGMKSPGMTPELALRMQKFVEELEARAAARGMSMPKHSHRFAPENLWPDESKEN